MENSADKITHHIDLPLDWNNLVGCLLIRGWCFGARGQSVRAIRLKAGALTFCGEVGLARPDVKATLPDAPNENCGFVLRGILPPGAAKIVIEVQLPHTAIWLTMLTRTVKVRRRWLPLWLGGGDWSELLFSQVPCQNQYAPRSIAPETFPRPPTDRTSWPKFSIVTPSFQQARFLTQTLRSVLEQTEVTGEYVVQDGGSKDGSAEIIRTHATAASRPSSIRLSAWESLPDDGQAAAIAAGFTKTSGAPDDVMAWINSDDFYLPGSLAFVAEYFARHPQVDVIYGHRLLIDEHSREIGRWHLATHDADVLRRYDFVPQETLFWRRRIWDKVGGLDASLQFAMDWDLLLRFQAAGACMVRVPYFLACFRIHQEQKTSAQMATSGQREIDALRFQTFAREISPAEIESDPRLLRYLRRGALLKFLRRCGLRAR